MSEFLLLLGGQQYLRERALAGARQVTKAQIWFAAPDPRLNCNRYFDGALAGNDNDPEQLIRQIEALKPMRFLGAVALNDWVLATSHKINRHFGLRALSQHTIESARKKNIMKEHFIKANLPVAKGFLIIHSSQLQEALDYVGFPAIIKPYDFGGSGGVILAHNFAQAQSALAEAQELIATHKKNFGIAGDKYLIEEYIDSDDEVSVEVICYNNQYKVIAITEKYLSPKPWFSEMAHIVPSHRNTNTALRTLAKEACKAT